MGKWDSWNIRGHTLEYDDESHTYLCDGLIVPSVTEIIREYLGSKYDGVPDDVLAEAARKGTLLHEVIESAEKSACAETYELSSDEAEMSDEFASYLRLKKEYGITCEGNEMPLLIYYKGRIVAAGRMDMLAFNGDGELGIIDFKRTYELDDEYLAFQLTLYGMGVKFSYNIDPKFYACMWLRGKRGKFVPYDPIEKRVEEMLDGFLMREAELVENITYDN